MRNNNLFVSNYKKWRRSFLIEVMEWIFTFLITVVVSLFILGNVFSITGIKGRSMEPNFFEGERIFNYKLGYYFSAPKSGEVVILSKSKSKKGIILNPINEGKDIIDNITQRIKKSTDIEVKYIIKRVIGVAGDTIDIKDGFVYVNGERLEENYIKGQTFENSDFTYPVIIPENKVFVLGDNRENSLDSRELGLIDNDQVKGKAVFKLWPINSFGKVE